MNVSNGGDAISRDVSPSKMTHNQSSYSVVKPEISRNHPQTKGSNTNRTSGPTYEGVEALAADDHLDKTKVTRYFKNSDKFSDVDIDTYISNLRKAENTLEAKQSVSKRNLEEKHIKMLRNYDKYQDLWMRNLDKSKEVRNRCNDRGISQNYKFNLLHTANTGDLITVQDRADSSLMKNQYKNCLLYTSPSPRD